MGSSPMDLGRVLHTHASWPWSWPWTFKCPIYWLQSSWLHYKIPGAQWLSQSPTAEPCGSLVILPTHFWSKISEMGLSGEGEKNSLTSPMSPNHQGNTAQGQENAVSLLFLSWGKLRVCEQDTVNGTHFCLTPSRILSVSLGLLSSWVN